MIRLIKLILYMALVVFVCASVSEAVECKRPNDVLRKKAVTILDAAWGQAESDLTQLRQRLLDVENTKSLYDAQTYTSNILMVADYYKDKDYIEKLAELYSASYSALTLVNEYKFKYPGGPHGDKRHVTLKLPSSARIWSSDDEFTSESILHSSQFLYAISRLIRIIVEIDDPSKNLIEFKNKFIPIVVNDHYLRWINRDDGMPGHFQVRGWGCSDGSFSHHEHVANLLSRKYGTEDLSKRVSLKSYCNAVRDVDLLIISGVSEIYAAMAYSKSPKVSESIMAGLKKYLLDGSKLLKQRHVVKFDELVNKNLAVFDPGAFTDHPDFRFAGYEITESDCNECIVLCPEKCTVFPGSKLDSFKSRNRPIIAETFKVEDVGWDIGHARRLVPVYDSLVRHRKLLGASFPDRNSVGELAAQFLFKVLNKDTSDRSLMNYFDGSNGWYRVNYNNRVGFGYAPSVRTRSGMIFGYGFWSEFEPEILKATSAINKKYSSENDHSLLNLMLLPETLHYSGLQGFCKW